MATSPRNRTSGYRTLRRSIAQTEAACAQCRARLEREAGFCVECGAAVVVARPGRSLKPSSRNIQILDAVRLEIEASLDELVAAEDAARGADVLEIEEFEVVESLPTDFTHDVLIALDGLEAAHGGGDETVVALGPQALLPRPYWPAPAPGGTVVAPPPKRPDTDAVA